MYCGKSCENRKDSVIDHRRMEKDNFALMDNNGSHAAAMNNAQLHGIALARWISLIVAYM